MPFWRVSLDFSHAFDCISAKFLGAILTKALPSHCLGWARVLVYQWEHLSRWFHFGGHCHDRCLVGDCGIPQGDPASPFALLLLLLAGKVMVAQQVPGIIWQCIYMDDRMAVTQDREDAIRAAQAWQMFAQKIHMKENVSKTQYIDLTLASAEGDISFKQSCEHLGTCIGNPGTAEFRSGKNLKRTEKALEIASRISLLPCGTQLKLDDCKVFGLSRASSSASSWRARALCGARKGPGLLHLVVVWMAFVVEIVLYLTMGLSALGCIATRFGEMDVFTPNFGGFMNLWSMLSPMMGSIMGAFWGVTNNIVGLYMQGSCVSSWECRLLPIMPAWMMLVCFMGCLIQGFWMSNQKGSVRALGAHQLHALFRGGAGGSDTTDRKRQFTNLVSKLVGIIEKMTDEMERGDDNHTDNHQASFLKEFTQLIHRWESDTPTCGELQQALVGLISKDITHRERPLKSSDQGFSFYKQFLKEKEEKDQQHRTDQLKGGKGFGKTKPGQKGKGPVLPRFDLAKLCPQRNMISWQRLASLLEKGDAGSDASLNNAICILDSYYRMLELQNMAEAHEYKIKTILICKTADSEEFDNEDGGRCEMLPYMGNLTLMRARITCLDRSEPSFRGIVPLKSEAPGMARGDGFFAHHCAPFAY